MFTVLLVHHDVDFTDSSKSNHAVTLNNAPVIDKTIYNLGNGSGKYSGVSSQSVQYSGNLSNFNIGTGDFTIDFWINFTQSVNQLIQATDDVANNDFNVQYNGLGSLQIFLNATGYSFSWTPSTSTWYHIAIERDGTNLRAFVNGSQIGTTQTSSDNVPTPASFLILGALGNNTFNLSAYLDEYRISKGIARWTSNFSLPTTPYCSGCEMVGATNS